MLSILSILPLSPFAPFPPFVFDPPVRLHPPIAPLPETVSARPSPSPVTPRQHLSSSIPIRHAQFLSNRLASSHRNQTRPSSRHTSRVTPDQLSDSLPVPVHRDCAFIAALKGLLGLNIRCPCGVSWPLLPFLVYRTVDFVLTLPDSDSVFITCPASLKPLPRDRNFCSWLRHTLSPWLRLRRTWWASTIEWVRRSVKDPLVLFSRAPTFSTTSKWRSNSYVLPYSVGNLLRTNNCRNPGRAMLPSCVMSTGHTRSWLDVVSTQNM